MRRARWVGLAVLGGAVAVGAARADYAGRVLVPGDAADLGVGKGPPDRLGGFFSDLFYDRHADLYYGLADRGPGGGLIPYATRVQQFSLTVDPDTGSVSGFKLLKTIPFRTADGAAAFTGLKPELVKGADRSFDPEGFVVTPSGTFLVAEEYGPTVVEFQPVETPAGTEARFVRAFTTPPNLLPKTAPGPDGRPAVVAGRAENRGFEGLAITPDGKTAVAVLQGPLADEGDPDGRFGRHVRLVAFDVASGRSTAQYVYPFEALADLNARLPPKADRYHADAQGRALGVSAIAALTDTTFLVLERDARGAGIEDPAGRHPVASKRVYEIDLAGATDVSAVSLAKTNALPAGVVPVKKTLRLDLQAELAKAGVKVPEKFEGLAVGPRLRDGRYALLLGVDNDFSVTQTGAGEQLDVFTDGTGVRYARRGRPDRSFATPDGKGKDLGPVPAGYGLLPSGLYSFPERLPTYTPPAKP